MFSRKKEETSGLPDLPAPNNLFGGGDSLPSMDAGEDEEHSLPAFPDSPSHNRFSEAVIKDAVGSPDEIGEIGSVSGGGGSGGGATEMEEWSPSVGASSGAEFPMASSHEDDDLDELEEPMSPSLSRPMPQQGGYDGPKGMDDVFVKLDKFHSARRTITEVKHKLQDMDDLIKRIRETKLREEQELANWEKNLNNVKSRIEGVTESIFEKVE